MAPKRTFADQGSSQGVKKRKALTLEDRIKVIRMKDRGSKVKDILQKIDAGQTQIYAILKDRENLLEIWNSGKMNRKRKILTAGRQKYPEINRETWEWFTKKRATNNVITGSMIQEQARIIALRKGITHFEGSNGWLRTFIQRHSISRAILTSTIKKCLKKCGFSGEASQATQEEEAFQFYNDDLQSLKEVAPESTLEDLLQMDSNIATHNQECGETGFVIKAEEEEWEDADEKTPEPRSLRDSLSSVTALIEDAKGRRNMEWLSTAQKLRDLIQEEQMKCWEANEYT
ncbi:uncharacterized protein LOC109519268 isoform X1 [Hippocampus comes]|uniref:Uncharacterized LOC109519268 n=1 Tax=Hippocampus comes TaxID=109280 RepID=A0A3Q2YAH5_HIPCM|nr:PREDICTED: uncharacterized protein LOC109519268 isoform X1 [Hippocampus comes]